MQYMEKGIESSSIPFDIQPILFDFNHALIPDFGSLKAEHINCSSGNIGESKVVSALLQIVLIRSEVIVTMKGTGLRVWLVFAL